MPSENIMKRVTKEQVPFAESYLSWQKIPPDLHRHFHTTAFHEVSEPFLSFYWRQWFELNAAENMD
jgi:hypothetical protein